ncbi:hypothetical protein J2W32_003343 [Variovorax boronicumulans]|uniref:DUF3014 domain-containing protein n=1 Tax=Variovorax boronicumulans TaxID=436515 RepID=A0AAW8CZZ1_9BURK|nr:MULTISPECIES: DUF3014 domain-containing protein [Variovorax]MDP9894467.1 hypothetical protein [Variovorax boronicumulans]MDQ0032923.1 hypothetical protein [Variovorax boronicumulans]MDQ0039665.1 hypothetical protein [Variovorax boronicumulans]MDQ0054286.1 hypothetical protein [Variovorax boronicumulans]MDQ0609234.1 hypothetical protein [Variovorax sp. W1I1]
MTDNDSPGSRDDAPDFRPRRETPIGMIVAIGLVVLVAAFFGWRWYQQQQKPPESAPVATAPNDGPAPAPAATEPTGPQNPIEALAPPDAALPALAESDSRVMKALAELLGGKHASDYLRSDGIVRRFVATVDNLAREQAPASAWPVQPTGQRFITDGPQGGTQTIAANNAARYNGIVLLAETVDPAKAATVYAKLYPLFQKAYEELGFPGRYFNDRLIAVIDHLLQAPEPSGPVQVRLVEVKGDVPSTRPWVRYEYVDPKLEAMSSGQKIMVRMGPENERKVKASLRGFRQQIATGELAKKKQP